MLCYLQGMTHELAASELGWPVGTVRGRLAQRGIETGTGRGGGLSPSLMPPMAGSLAVQGDFRTNLTNLYDASTGREIRRFEGERTANCLAFSPDGKVLAGGFHDGPNAGIILWEVASGRVLRLDGRFLRRDVGAGVLARRQRLDLLCPVDARRDTETASTG